MSKRTQYKAILDRIREKLGKITHIAPESIVDFSRTRWRKWDIWHEENIVQFEELHPEVKEYYPDLVSEYLREIRSIEEALSELNYRPNYTWARKSSEISLHRHLAAVDFWDLMVCPIRMRDNYIFRIKSQEIGPPDIESIGVGLYITDVAEQTASDWIEIQRVQRNLTRWQVATAILGFILTWIIVIAMSK